jgi:hypothetical protein
MSTLVFAHVDEFSGPFHCPESSLAYGLRLPDKSDYGTVGGLPGVHIKHPYTFHLFNLGGDPADQVHVASLTEVRNALNDLIHDNNSLSHTDTKIGHYFHRGYEITYTLTRSPKIT